MRAFLHLQGPTTYMQLVCCADQYANSNYYKAKLHNVTEQGPKTVHVLKHAYANVNLLYQAEFSFTSAISVEIPIKSMIIFRVDTSNCNMTMNGKLYLPLLSNVREM